MVCSIHFKAFYNFAIDCRHHANAHKLNSRKINILLVAIYAIDELYWAKAISRASSTEPKSPMETKNKNETENGLNSEN